MHARDHHDNLAVDAEVDRVRKTTQQCPPRVSADDRISEWVLGDGIDQSLRRGQKLVAQAWALTFVPEKSFIDVRRRGWTDNDLHQSARLRMRSSTSFQGIPIGPSRSSSSSRRSSSSSWASVIGMVSGDRLSQSCSSRPSRSSGSIWRCRSCSWSQYTPPFQRPFRDG